ncbi:phage portal protein [Pseudophaeobacter sp.]|jgi:lambda family phage portal protein|uniref:phage portal protein n=1 Tax=Pseudophaeobacter sp. TaxID=1971739 RepID=UPI0032D94459
MFGKIFSRTAPVEEAPRRKAPPMLARVRRSGGVRNFDAGQSDRLTSGWTNTPLPADQIIRRNWRVLVARSREQTANNPYGKAFQRSARRNIVGQQGLVLQARVKDSSDGKMDQGANKALERSWKDWCKSRNCDVTGRRSFRQIQKELINGCVTDGEFMVRFVYGRDAGPWGFALQVLDPLRCPVDLDEDKLPGGGFIRAGIEYTKLGRPVAYHFTTLSLNEADYHHSGRGFVKVPADEIVHWFEADFVGQKRGLPWMATALWRMHQLGEFEKSALVAARDGANRQGFIEWDEGRGPDLDDEDEEDGIEIESEPGVYQSLPSGARIKSDESQYPNGEMAVFSKHMLRGVASGLGVAYNDLSNDLEGVNFSSIRHGMLGERDHWKELQESLIESFALPVYERWLSHGLLAGRITLENGSPLPAAKRQKFMAVQFQARRWEWIDPSKDVKADVEAIDNLIKPRGQVIRERGRDPREVYAEIAADIDDMRAEGIPEEIIQTLITAKSKGGQGNVQQSSTAKAGTPGEDDEE